MSSDDESAPPPPPTADSDSDDPVGEDASPPAPPSGEDLVTSSSNVQATSNQPSHASAGQDSPFYWSEIFDKMSDLTKFGQELERQLSHLFGLRVATQGKSRRLGKQLPGITSPGKPKAVPKKGFLSRANFKALPGIKGPSHQSQTTKVTAVSSIAAESKEHSSVANDSASAGTLGSPLLAKKAHGGGHHSLEQEFAGYEAFLKEHSALGEEASRISEALKKIAQAKSKLDQEMEEFVLTSQEFLSDIKKMELEFEAYKALHHSYGLKFQKYLKFDKNGSKQKLVEYDRKYATKKKELEEKRFDLDAMIRSIDARREVTVVKPLHSLLRTYVDYFQMGSQSLESVTSDIETCGQHARQSSKLAKRQQSASAEEKAESMSAWQKGHSGSAQDQGGSGIRDLETTQKTTSMAEKSGYLFLLEKGNHTVVWAELQGMSLTVQPMKGLKPDTKVFPQQVIMNLCTVKEMRDSKMRFCFSVITPQKGKSLVLQAETYQDMKEWMSVIQNAIMAGLDNNNESEQTTRTLSPEQKKKKVEEERHKQEREKFLKELQKIKGNQTCADCTAHDPDWVSLNLGILMCMECSGIHRALGVHISKVRSIKLDKIDHYLIDYLKTVGNRIANGIWEATLRDKSERPTAESKRAFREKFIRDKYEQKVYLADGKQKSLDKLNKKLWKAIEDDDPIGILEALAWGADPNFKNPEEDGRTALHQAVMYRNPILVELLLQHPNTKFDELELRGWSPLHYAAYQDDLETVEMIILRGGSRLASVKDHEGFDPLKSAQVHNEGELECAKILEEALAKAASRSS